MLVERPRKLGVWEEMLACQVPVLNENERMADVERDREADLLRGAISHRDPGAPFHWQSILVVANQKKKPMQQARELQIPQKVRRANA